MIGRLFDRRDRNPRYRKWLQRNDLEPGSQHPEIGQSNPIKVEQVIKPDPVKVEQGVKRETGLYMEQALGGMDDGDIMTILRSRTGFHFQTGDWLDIHLRTGSIVSSSPQSSSGSSCRHESNGTSQRPVSLRSWLKPRKVSTLSSPSSAQSGSFVTRHSDTTPELPSGSDSAGVSSPSALPGLASKGPGSSQHNDIDFIDLGPGCSRDDPFGGGNQFGIVTRFNLKTYKQKTKVWAGILTFSIDKASQVCDATQAFIASYDPLSHMYLSMGGGSNPQLSFINVYVFYNASSLPTGDANPFAAFYAAKPIADTTSTQNYSTLIASNNNGNTPQKRWLIGGHTFPNLIAPHGADLYLKQWQAFRDMANVTAAGDQNLLFSMALVPVPALAMRAGENVTGVKNVLGLEPDAGDAVWIDYTLAWLDTRDDSKMFDFIERISKAGDRLATSFEPKVPSTNAIPGAMTANKAEFYRTNPQYMNYALLNQPVQSSYGEKNEKFLQRVQKRYDPDGLWRRNGGFLWD
ncbi:6-hydroxy-d-nicotine oxidase [Fusarium sp. NRRL 52700]|nr:6-hydroxy-d-nicotine oxidase [Fusarium sp. NRRL 52700]